MERPWGRKGRGYTCIRRDQGLGLHSRYAGRLESPLPCSGHLCAFMLFPLYGALLPLSIHPNLPTLKVQPNPSSWWKPGPPTQLYWSSLNKSSHTLVECLLLRTVPDSVPRALCVLFTWQLEGSTTTTLLYRGETSALERLSLGQAAHLGMARSALELRESESRLPYAFNSAQ